MKLHGNGMMTMTTNATCENVLTLHSEDTYQDQDEIIGKKTAEDQTKQYITALKASEQALRELQAKKEKMYSIISHDLRSPVASIIGFCDLLLTNYDQIPKEEYKEYISCIKQSAHSQLQFINDLIDFSKLDSKQLKLQMVEVNLYLVARNVITSFMGIARHKKITLSSTLPPSLYIHGDERWIHQLFSNLIGNAIKFTQARGRVTISMTSQNEKGFTIAVSDTGVGISTEMQSKLFKIEEKFSTSGTVGEQGNGLGLPLCKEIMTNHGGKISVESRVGIGTTFRLSFPEIVMKQHLNILIVDDDPIVRLVHSNYVEQVFPMSKSIHATNGLDAIKQVEQFMPQLILTDFAMPNMDGFEMIKALKNDPKTSDIPVIVVTGHTSQANKEMLLLSGARAVVSKPLLHEEFAEIAKKILSEYTTVNSH